MQPVSIQGPLRFVAGVATAATLGGAAVYAGNQVYRETRREPGDEPVITKGKFAAYMVGSVLAGGAFVAADRLGGLDALARVANDAGRGAVVRAGAAAASGGGIGLMAAALPGMLLATGWGWVALAGDDW